MMVKEVEKEMEGGGSEREREDEEGAEDSMKNKTIKFVSSSRPTPYHALQSNFSRLRLLLFPSPLSCHAFCS